MRKYFLVSEAKPSDCYSRFDNGTHKIHSLTTAKKGYFCYNSSVKTSEKCGQCDHWHPSGSDHERLCGGSREGASSTTQERSLYWMDLEPLSRTLVVVQEAIHLQAESWRAETWGPCEGHSVDGHRSIVWHESRHPRYEPGCGAVSGSPDGGGNYLRRNMRTLRLVKEQTCCCVLHHPQGFRSRKRPRQQ